MRLERFLTKGSGTGGQGPGRVGNMILDKAGIIIELPETHPMVGLLNKFNGVEYVGHRMIDDDKAVTEPELSAENKQEAILNDIRARLKDRAVSSMALIRRAAGEPKSSRAKKADMIDAIMEALAKDDTVVMDRVMLAFSG